MLVTAVLAHSAIALEACAWVVGLGDGPAAELPGDGGRDAPVDNGSAKPIGATDTGGSDLGPGDGPAFYRDDVVDVVPDRSTEEAGEGSTEGSAADAPAESLPDSPMEASPESAADSPAPLSPEAGPNRPVDASPESAADSLAPLSPEAGPSSPGLLSPEGGSNPFVDASPEAGPDSPQGSLPQVASEAEAPLSPGMLAGLALWLDGTRGLSHVDGGGGGLTWADQSGQHNDATSMGTPAIHSRAIGGNPAVHFDGSSYLVVADRASLQFSTGDAFIALVAAQTTPTTGFFGYGVFYAKQVADRAPYLGITLVANSNVAPAVGAIWSQVALQAGGYVETSEADFNGGQPICVTVHRSTVANGATLAVRVNGSMVAANTGPGYAVDLSAIGYPAFIGGTPPGQNLLGDIAEVIAVGGPVSDLDVAGIEAYLIQKYSL